MSGEVDHTKPFKPSFLLLVFTYPPGLLFQLQETNECALLWLHGEWKESLPRDWVLEKGQSGGLRG